MPFDVPVGNIDKVLAAKEWYEKFYSKYPTRVNRGFLTLEDLKK